MSRTMLFIATISVSWLSHDTKHCPGQQMGVAGRLHRQIHHRYRGQMGQLKL